MEEGIIWIDSFFVRLQSYKEGFNQTDLPLWEITTRLDQIFLDNDGWGYETNANTISTLESSGDIKLIPVILRNKILDFRNKYLTNNSLKR